MRLKLAAERVIFRLHAVRRMFQRRITEQDVRHVLQTGELVEAYPDDTPYPSRLLLGWRGLRAIHVVVADNNEGEGTIIVITVYEPDNEQWEPGFRRRVR